MTLRALVLGLSLIAAAMAAHTTYAQSPDPARLAAAKEMMEVSGAVKQFDEAVPLMLEQLSRSFSQLVPDKSREIRDVFDQLSPRFRERKYELIDQIAALYA